MKLASLDDLENLVTLSEEFFNESPYTELPFSRDHVRGSLIEILTKDKTESVIIYEEGKGFIIGIVAPLLFSPVRAAVEVAWFVSKDERKGRLGLGLLEAFEYWSKEVAKTDVTTMSDLSNLDLSRLYERRGYRLFENSYLRKN